MKTKKRRMSERGLVRRLSAVLDRRADSVRTFADACMMTNNNGLVVRFADGTEFQITVVRSK